jgi:hypothetical protein
MLESQYTLKAKPFRCYLIAFASHCKPVAYLPDSLYASAKVNTETETRLQSWPQASAKDPPPPGRGLLRQKRQPCELHVSIGVSIKMKRT